jgi:hypothetical protein
MMYETTLGDKYEEFERLGLERKYAQRKEDEQRMIGEVVRGERAPKRQKK